MAGQNLASLLSGTQIIELIGRLGRFGLTPERVAKLAGDDELTEQWVTKLDEFPAFRLIHGLFTSTEKQIARIASWNKKRGWGIPDEAFVEAEKSVPKWPEEKLVVVTLVPYLDDEKKGRKGVERTFHELWDGAAKQQHANWRWDGYDKAGPDKLRLLSGIEHKPGLRWEVIDMGCQRNLKPMDVRNPEKSPHAGVLASAMLHPEWIKSMDGENVPYVWAPGYEVNVSGEGPWRYVPLVFFIRGDRQIELGCGWYGGYGSGWAVPSFVRE